MKSEKLHKILALADSSHEGEALAALRHARQLLEQDGLGFSDLTEALYTSANVRKKVASGIIVKPTTPPSPELQQLQYENHSLARETVRLRREISALTSEAQKQTQEAERWKKLAEQTAENLWKVGQEILQLQDELHVLRDAQQTSKSKREQVLQHLQADATQVLSDREIARRVGVAPQTVANWRKRLRQEVPATRQVRRSQKSYQMRVDLIGKSQNNC